MFNSDQREWVAYLASLPASEKCPCGWDHRHECYNCNREEFARRGGAVVETPEGSVYLLNDARMTYGELCVWLRRADGN